MARHGKPDTGFFQLVLLRSEDRACKKLGCSICLSMSRGMADDISYTATYREEQQRSCNHILYKPLHAKILYIK